MRVSVVFVQKDKNQIALRVYQVPFAFPTIKCIVILNASLSVSILSVFNFSLGHLIAHAAPDMRVERFEFYQSMNIELNHTVRRIRSDLFFVSNSGEFNFSIYWLLANIRSIGYVRLHLPHRSGHRFSAYI